MSQTRRIIGIVLTAIAVLFLTFDGAMKLVAPKPVVEGSARMGFGPEKLAPIGIVLLVCVALYVVPRTAVLGAVLLTGYLGGAVATHVRVGDPLLTHTLFPVFMGVFVWLGLYLRRPDLKLIAPWSEVARRKATPGE